MALLVAAVAAAAWVPFARRVRRERVPADALIPWMLAGVAGGVVVGWVVAVLVLGSLGVASGA